MLIAKLDDEFDRAIVQVKKTCACPVPDILTWTFSIKVG